MRYDLHVHSTCSDGSLSPTAVAEEAARRKLAGFALTDHDQLDGLEPAAARAAELGVDFLPGVEITVSEDGGAKRLHMLGYGIDPAHPPLFERLRQLRERRAQRAESIAERLAAEGVQIDLDRLIAENGGGTLGRPHLARALVESGVCRNSEDAFERFLRRGRPAYLPAPGISARDAIDLIHAAGGAAALAHPPRSAGADGPGGLERFVSQLVELGLDALEVGHPSHKPATRKRLRRIARDHALLETAGSDFHGAGKPGIRLGQESTSPETWAELKARAR